LCLYAKINTKIKFLGDFGHIHRPLTYHGILRKVNLSLIERVNYVEEMVLQGSQKLHDLNLKKKKRNAVEIEIVEEEQSHDFVRYTLILETEK
jgi:hypothetical protein